MPPNVIMDTASLPHSIPDKLVALTFVSPNKKAVMYSWEDRPMPAAGKDSSSLTAKPEA